LIRLFSCRIRRFRTNALILPCVCLAGLICGAVAAYRCIPFSSQMLRLSFEPMSIVDAARIWCIPFLLSLIFGFVHRRFVLLAAFIKSFTFSLCFCLCSHAFGDGGWMARMLLLFTSVCSYPVLCWLWLKQWNAKLRCRHIALSVIALMIISLIDHSLVSPFWAMLI